VKVLGVAKHLRNTKIVTRFYAIIAHYVIELSKYGK